MTQAGWRAAPGAPGIISDRLTVVIESRGVTQLMFPLSVDSVFGIDIAVSGQVGRSVANTQILTRAGAWQSADEIADYVQGDGTDAQRIALADGIRQHWGGTSETIPADSRDAVDPWKALAEAFALASVPIGQWTMRHGERRSRLADLARLHGTTIPNMTTPPESPTLTASTPDSESEVPTQ